MAKVISIALQKGGAGKTTTALNLSADLGYKKKRVLLIDMDSQENSTYASGIDEPQHTIFNVLNNDCTADEAIIHCKYYDVLSADTRLTTVEMTEGVNPELLKAAIEPLQSQYDFIVIDTPPALGNLLYNSLVASDYVIIATEPRPFNIQGLGALYNTIEAVRNGFNSSLKVLGILLIKYHNRTVLNRDLGDMIKRYAEQMETVVFEKSIREGIAVPESQTVRQPLIDYAKNSKPCIDYKGFTSEILGMIGE